MPTCQVSVTVIAHCGREQWQFASPASISLQLHPYFASGAPLLPLSSDCVLLMMPLPRSLLGGEARDQDVGPLVHYISGHWIASQKGPQFALSQGNTVVPTGKQGWGCSARTGCQEGVRSGAIAAALKPRGESPGLELM